MSRDKPADNDNTSTSHDKARDSYVRGDTPSETREKLRDEYRKENIKQVEDDKHDS